MHLLGGHVEPRLADDHLPACSDAQVVEERQQAAEDLGDATTALRGVDMQEGMADEVLRQVPGEPERARRGEPPRIWRATAGRVDLHGAAVPARGAAGHAATPEKLSAPRGSAPASCSSRRRTDRPPPAGRRSRQAELVLDPGCHVAAGEAHPTRRLDGMEVDRAVIDRGQPGGKRGQCRPPGRRSAPRRDGRGRTGTGCGRSPALAASRRGDPRSW